MWNYYAERVDGVAIYSCGVSVGFLTSTSVHNPKFYMVTLNPFFNMTILPFCVENEPNLCLDIYLFSFFNFWFNSFVELKNKSFFVHFITFISFYNHKIT